MTEGTHPQAPPPYSLALAETIVAGLFVAGGVALTAGMPGLIAAGGILEAQDFLRLSPIFFPRITFGLLTVLSAFLLAGALRRLRAAERGLRAIEPGGLVRVAVVFALALAYPFLLAWLGFGLTSILILACLTVYLGNRDWARAVAFAVLTPVLIRFIFERALNISLPSAEIDFLARAEESVMRFLANILLP